MTRRIIKRRKTQKRRRTRQRGGGCNPASDCNDCPEGHVKNHCLDMQRLRGPAFGTRSQGPPRGQNGGKSRRRRIKRKGTKRRKP